MTTITNTIYVLHMGNGATYDDAVRYGRACEREFARRYPGCTVDTIIRDHVEGTGSGAYSDDIDSAELHDVRQAVWDRGDFWADDKKN